MSQLGDILEGFDELVDAVALREEDDELVDGVRHGFRERRGRGRRITSGWRGTCADNSFENEGNWWMPGLVSLFLSRLLKTISNSIYGWII